MAVSLSDAWNDTPLMSPQVPVVSAKKTLPLSEVESEIEAPPVMKEKETIDYTMYLEEIIFEMKEMRKEETKRSTIYIIVSGLLFAILLMYVDRLQTRVKDLSTNVRRIHWINHSNNFREPLSPFSESLPWYN